MRIAAIQYEARQGETIDDILRTCARTLKNGGHRLAGAVQINAPREGFSRCDMTIEDLASGRLIEASDKTRVSGGCRLDAYALEDAAGLVAQAIGEETDLVIINRFGKQEALGQGFRSAIESAVMHGVPVLTSYNSANRDAFDAFSGGAADVLPPAAGDVIAWCRAAIAERTA